MSKKYVLIIISVTLFAIASSALFVFWMDPCFLYRAPREGTYYVLREQRYQNNGILRHFTYDAVITGTSMTENFLPSEFDSLFGTHSVKVPNSGGSWREMHDRLCTAFASKNQVKIVLWGLDYKRILLELQEGYTDFPEYLYDNNPFNDILYLCNKDMLFCSLDMLIGRLKGESPTSFDTYSYWGDRADFRYGKQSLDEIYHRKEQEAPKAFSKEDLETVTDNVEHNILSLVKANPDTTFYLFFSPYSIYAFDEYQRSGNLARQLEAEKVAIELLIPYENVRLFSFFDDFELVTNLDNYKDTTHYGPWVNSMMLGWMKQKAHQLTKENYRSYLARTRAFYESFEYDALFR